MRNAHFVHDWKLTPAVSRSTYPDGKEVCTVTKVDRGKDGDGYHVEAPNGATYYVSFWESDNTWCSQRVTGETPAMHLANPARTLSKLLETLRMLERIRDLEGRLQVAYGG